MPKNIFKKRTIFLAPMAGVTDSGFRQICRKYGADATVTEMVSAKGMYYKDKKSFELLKHTQNECPISMQIFGSDTECIKFAVESINQTFSPISIDINMGCPAPKIYQNGEGSALMKDINKAYDIICSAKQNSDIPISVKFRSGINDENINAVEFAIMCERAGADFITVHGRTREQFYSGESKPEIIKAVVNAVSIPVIANGDISDGLSAEKILGYTGAHSIMIGRAALGNPLVFNEIKSHFNIADKIDVSKSELFDIALEHLSNIITDKGEIIAVREFRKHMLWYLKGVKNASKYKQMSCNVVTYSDCKNIFEQVKKEF